MPKAGETTYMRGVGRVRWLETVKDDKLLFVNVASRVVRDYVTIPIIVGYIVKPARQKKARKGAENA
jgi:hypothetical protein